MEFAAWLTSEELQRLEVLASVANVCVAGLGLLVTVIGLWFVSQQIRITRKTSNLEYLLRFDEMLRQYDDIHVAVQDPSWHIPENEEDTAKGREQWTKLVSYLGLFERLKIAIDDDVIALHIVDKVYAYRVRFLVNNDYVYQEVLSKEPESWTDFIQLCFQLASIEMTRKKQDPHFIGRAADLSLVVRKPN